MVNLVARVRRLVKSELAVTSVIRLAKISDSLNELRRVAVPNAFRAFIEFDGWKATQSRCESVSNRSFECKTNKQNPWF